MSPEAWCCQGFRAVRIALSSGWEGSCIGWIGPQAQLGSDRVDIFGQGGVTSEPTEGDVKHSGGLAIVYPERHGVSGAATEAPRSVP